MTAGAEPVDKVRRRMPGLRLRVPKSDAEYGVGLGFPERQVEVPVAVFRDELQATHGFAWKPRSDISQPLGRLALSASGHERMVNGWAAASGEERFDFSAGIARFGDIMK